MVQILKLGAGVKMQVVLAIIGTERHESHAVLTDSYVVVLVVKDPQSSQFFGYLLEDNFNAFIW